jgi:hypothetical protein
VQGVHQEKATEVLAPARTVGSLLAADGHR